jgi:hypothetical protein
MTAEQEHSSLVKSGMFWEFFPELTGFWNEDKDVFTAWCKSRYSDFNDTEEKASE